MTFCEATIPTDANSDGYLNESDAEGVAHYIITGDTENFIFNNANVNYDDKVNTADLVIIINMIDSAQQ